jgi:hypothetical protein
MIETENYHQDKRIANDRSDVRVAEDGHRDPGKVQQAKDASDAFPTPVASRRLFTLYPRGDVRSRSAVILSGLLIMGWLP